MALLLAAISLAVRTGDPKATLSAFRPSRPPEASNALFKSGKTRSGESATTRSTAAGTPAAEAADSME